MHNRRTFIQASAAAASVSLAAGALGTWQALRARAADAHRIAFYKVLFDRDHPAAVAFGRAAQGPDLAAQAIGRDVTTLWYNDLYHRWRQGPAAIAGMMPVRVAFCLQLLARDVGMRVVFRAEHTPTRDGRLVHRLTGPRSVLDRMALLDTAADWPLGVARLVGDCRADFSAQSTATLTTASASGFASREPLVSWVISPAAHV